jgi:hypothetical protein
VVNLAAGPATGPETVFTYRDLATAPTFDGGVMNGSTTLDEITISDASGSFTVTWSVTRIDITISSLVNQLMPRSGSLALKRPTFIRAAQSGCGIPGRSGWPAAVDGR